ncbi:DUF3265 domain-containing protein [Vibrio harveyi]|nr:MULTISPECIES: DUF3265 domain-containing protein [Vibrio]ELY1985195.1 DUF3265 domain-containing protein [Vibrio harveyi]EMB9230909.1 DUF3265 domain-containing protein [Vibrio harveyi]MCQ9072395.1 DUF3265 domain-containing protein [Vibrio harveyi]MCQ9081878.1 DUF3265 domain-containing protein [Vibrio harveyi]HDM8146736.1 DUF3265 domain-containing protein [Vibrio harveyi]
MHKTICSRGIHNAWHFCYALRFVFKVACGSFCIACSFLNGVLCGV